MFTCFMCVDMYVNGDKFVLQNSILLRGSKLQNQVFFTCTNKLFASAGIPYSPIESATI